MLRQVTGPSSPARVIRGCANAEPANVGYRQGMTNTALARATRPKSHVRFVAPAFLLDTHPAID